MKASLFAFLALSIPLLTLLWLVWGSFRLHRLRSPLFVRAAFALSTLLVLGCYGWLVLQRMQIVQAEVPPWLIALVLIWGIICLPFLAMPIFAAATLLSIGRLFAKRSPAPPAPAEDPPSAMLPGMTRRQMLGTTAIALPMLAAFGTTAYGLQQVKRFRIREITVRLPQLPAALDGMRIAHISDTHVGKFTKGAVLQQLAEQTNRLQADLVLITGDLIDYSIQDLPAAVRMVQHIDRRSGLFVIEGNHDLFDDARAFVRGVREGGISLLRDETDIVLVRGQPVQILGIRWDHDEDGMNRSIDHVASLRRPEAFPILLAHHPHAFDRAAEHGIPLTLAGHTHGGQLMITPKIGPAAAMFRYWSGLYRKGDHALVVSNGAGNWFPLRVNAPAEIVHLTLRQA